MLSVSKLQNMLSSNIAANVSEGESPQIFNEYGNKNEVSFLEISSNSREFIKDSPYVVEFPVAPTSMSCFHFDGKMEKPTSVKFKSIKVDLKEKTATIKTKNWMQQMVLMCLVKYPEVMDAREGKLTFGSDTIPFDITIEDNSLVTAASAKTDKSISISGVSTDALSETTALRAELTYSLLQVPAGATCDLDIEGTKSTIPVVLNETTVDGDDLSQNLYFDLSESKIATGKKFSIKCDSKMVEVTTAIKGFETMTLTGDSASSFIHVNSAASVGVAVAIVASAASIMSLFF